MSWLQVRAAFESAPPDFSPMIEVFRTHGIENTIEEETSLSGCLVDVEGSAAQVERLRDGLLALGAIDVQISPLVEVDWESSWKQFFKPQLIGGRFLVTPSWEQPEQKPGEFMITLDPGQAFGTGDHPTTRMCLQLLAGLDVAGKQVADLGCGSGILAIAATMTGAIVTASDLDPIAVEVTRENAARNDVMFSMRLGDGFAAVQEGLEAPQDETPVAPAEFSDLEEPPPIEFGTYDLVLSNIISHTLIRLAKPVSAATRSGGRWIVSGIIDENWGLVVSAAMRAGFMPLEELHEDGWTAGMFLKTAGL